MSIGVVPLTESQGIGNRKAFREFGSDLRLAGVVILLS